jgi:hypothetical protein
MQFFDLLLRHRPELRASSPPFLPPASLPLSLSSRRKRGRRTGGVRVVRPSVRPSVRPKVGDSQGLWNKYCGLVASQRSGENCVLLTAGRQRAAEKAFQTTRAPWYGSDAQECPHVIKGAPHIPERYTMCPWICGFRTTLNPGTSEWLCFYTRPPCSDKILLVIIINY